MIEHLSEKQADILDFVVSDDMALICDGAVRTGKTTVMGAGFLIWAMEYYDRTNFGICGKTVQSAERNVIKPITENTDLPYSMEYKVTTKILTVRCGEKENWFYVFGGKDESSYMLIQGITLAGVFFDEVALMPKSFVEQALSRAISYEHPKYWFNCNPGSPNHWFYKEWILPEKPGVRHLHFLLEDNPVLTPGMIERTKALHSGVFYARYIEGRWVVAEGLVYDCFHAEEMSFDILPDAYYTYYISVDYGTQNPCSMGLWAVNSSSGVAYRVSEYYYSGRAEKAQKTDEEYYEALEKLAGDHYIEYVVVDPSAASFIETIRRHERFDVRKANNDVLFGIRTVATLLQRGRIKIHRSCQDTIREFGLYSWDDKATEDRVIKDNDHAMDDIRYFVMTILRRELRWEVW